MTISFFISNILGSRVYANIPADVSYTLTETQRIPKLKRIVTVHLNKEVSKEVLIELGTEIRTADPQSYRRTFILYLLPGMEEGKGAWAYTHFIPDLEVKILGFTAEEKKATASAPVADGSRMIGHWVDNGPAARRIRVIQKGDQVVMSMKFKDGSSLDWDMSTQTTKDGLRLERKTNSRGDYYIVNASGDLEGRDPDGLIATYPKASD